MGTESNRRIAKNTLFLYFRMLLTMSVSLYTVRIVFRVLGVVDYGIYEIVAGIVELFSFFSSSMASASQRFFAFEIGRNETVQLKQTFSLITIIYFVIAGIILLLAETIGLWFVNYKLVIPANRLYAANWIYQFSILTFIVAILTIPYNAIIIAREKMAFYAYVSIIEVILKLVIVYILLWFDTDKLILFGFLIMMITCFSSLFYKIYCSKRFEECRFSFYWNKKLFHTLLTYSGWNLFGACTYIAQTQGVNVLLNIFFGPVLNAARGIAFRVSTIVNSFSYNFYTAIQPQIIKFYAQGNNQAMMNLVFKSSRFSYYLLLLISLPLLVETEYILFLWLGAIDNNMVVLTQLSLIYVLVNSLENPLTQAARATGDIRRYQVYVGVITLSTLPICYILLKFGFPPQSTICTMIIVYVVALWIRLWVLKRQINLSVQKYFSEVVMRIIIVTLSSLIVPYLLHSKIHGLSSFIFKEVIYITWTIAVIFFLGLTRYEKVVISKYIKNALNKLVFLSAFSTKS